MNTTHDMPTASVTIDAIVAASRKPCPTIVERFELLYSDGVWRAGDPPHGVRFTGDRRSVGFVYRSKDGTTFGTRHASRDVAESLWNQTQDNQGNEFRRHLEIMTPEELASQASYWLRSESSKVKR